MREIVFHIGRFILGVFFGEIVFHIGSFISGVFISGVSTSSLCYPVGEIEEL